jgi:uncharacterized protein
MEVGGSSFASSSSAFPPTVPVSPVHPEQERWIVEPRISFVTLGVSDLERATRFYAEGLQLPRLKSPASVSFFELGKTWLALYPRHLLAADAGVPAAGSGFPGFALAHNVRSKDDTDRLLDQVAAAGGRIVKPARRTEWGGYAGYFADPDGFLWEVAWNPHFPHV